MRRRRTVAGGRDRAATLSTVRANPSRVCVSSVSNVSRFECVLVALGQAELAPPAIVRGKQLLVVADVEPLPSECVRIERRTRGEPREEVPRPARNVPVGAI